jgi:hypothetical protein
MNKMKNLLTRINNTLAASLTWNVVYAPDVSESRDPIQNYKVIGHPKLHAWKTSLGHRVFTAPVRNRDKQFRTFRADRVLGVSLAVW